jgi:hypothetical protein
MLVKIPSTLSILEGHRHSRYLPATPCGPLTRDVSLPYQMKPLFIGWTDNIVSPGRPILRRNDNVSRYWRREAAFIIRDT